MGADEFIAGHQEAFHLAAVVVSGIVSFRRVRASAYYTSGEGRPPHTDRDPCRDADGRGRTRTDADARGRIHNASPGYIPLFASVTFTVDTTYDQAQAILRGHVYPWTCDEPRSDAPPPLAEQQANFAAWHGLLMSYPTWDELARIASSPQVVSVDGTPLYPCP
jgi:hypothetical protein